MLYWGIFTAGYILGVAFKTENITKSINLASKSDLNPDKIFDQLTQINTFSNKNLNKRAVIADKIQFFLSRLKTAVF